jgi:hypothetical protein
MIVSPLMLVEPAKKAGMLVPDSLEGEIDGEKYPHFNVFCNAQLCRPLSSWSDHWENAKIVAEIPDDKIRTLTYSELIERGWIF